MELEKPECQTVCIYDKEGFPCYFTTLLKSVYVI